MTASLARRWKIDVSEDGSNWVPLRGLTDFNPKIDPTLQDANDYDTDGWASKEITLLGWTLDCKANRKTDTGVFDPGQELCRKHSVGFGDDARLYVRWYDRNNGPEAYQGRGIVGYTQSKTGVTDLEEVAITITGDGARQTIPNPLATTGAPAITTLSASTIAQGKLLSITGTGFTGASAIKFGSTAAPTFTVVSDALAVATVPTVTGSNAVTVTVGAKTSNGVNVTVTAS
jgi:hypothetical protein